MYFSKPVLGESDDLEVPNGDKDAQEIVEAIKAACKSLKKNINLLKVGNQFLSVPNMLRAIHNMIPSRYIIYLFCVDILFNRFF